LRVSFNGRTSASQAENEGSIPFTRSKVLCQQYPVLPTDTTAARLTVDQFSHNTP
jgi:hypothetical protein